MDPPVPWQYTYNRLAAQGATSGELHHHFAQVIQKKKKKCNDNEQLKKNITLWNCKFNHHK